MLRFGSLTDRLGVDWNGGGPEAPLPDEQSSLYILHKSSSPFALVLSQGAPSQCYVFDGDGVCEEFERSSSIQDCGYFSPLGYTDQWASTAAASHQHPERCPAHAATGEPSVTQVRSRNHTAQKGFQRTTKLVSAAGPKRREAAALRDAFSSPPFLFGP